MRRPSDTGPRVVLAVFGAAALTLYLLEPRDAVRAAVMITVAAAPVASIPYAIVRLRLRPVVPWALLAAAYAAFAVGWVFWEGRIVSSGAPPNPDEAIAFVFQPGYPLLAAGLAFLLRRREPDQVVFIDFAIVASALLVPATWLLLYDYAADDTLSAAWRINQIGYGVFDVVLLAGLLRLLVSSGKRSPAFAALLASVACWLASDFVWNWSTRLGSYLPGSWADTGWITSATLLAIAAVSPGARELFERRSALERRARLDRLLVLAVAALVGPAVLVVATLRHGLARGEVVLIALSSALLSLLVLGRLALVLREQGRLGEELAAGRERLLAAEQRARAGSERTAAVLREQNERLRELDRMKDDFVASVSHELRTPLTSIRGYLELVLDREAGELSDEQEQFLKIVQRNAERLLRVVGDLLFVAQVEAGTIALERSRVDLAEILRQSYESAVPAAEGKGVALSLAADGPAALDGDPARLAQVLDNLVSNALKFTDPGGRVELRGFAANGSAVIEVADSGMGIAPADRERLFQRFFRAGEATRQAIHGTGLGLSIAKAIVDAHGGRISVESVVGEGTTFRVELPRETDSGE